MENVKSNTRYRAYQFFLQIINLVKDFPNGRVYSIFVDQLLRSATSVGANLTEAKASSSKKDFIKFYDIALKSCNETVYWLCLLKNGKLAEDKKIELLIDEITQISRMVGSSLLTLKGKKI